MNDECVAGVTSRCNVNEYYLNNKFKLNILIGDKRNYLYVQP